MSDFELEYTEVEEQLGYPVAISTFEGQSEQRRAISTKNVIGFSFKSIGLTKSDMQSHRSFFKGKTGALTGFTWTSPFDDTEYNVRYVPGSFQSIYSEGRFDVEWAFQIIDADEV